MRMPKPPFLFLLPLLSLPAVEVVGQEVTVAHPGAVVTVLVEPPDELTGMRDSSGGIGLAYAIEAAGDVRTLGQKAGTFRWESGELPRFPVTLRVPDRAQAGDADLAVVAFEAANGRTGSVPVRVRVAATRQLDVQLVAEAEAAPAGKAVVYRYVLTNLGNAGDSVALSIETNLGERPQALPRSVWLAPYEERSGEFTLEVPHGMPTGAEMYVRLSARSADVSVTENVALAVLPERGPFPDLVHIPTTVFLGSTLTSFEGASETEPVIAMTGNGRLGRDTELLFNYRYMPRGGSVYAFRGLLSGPRLLVGLERPSWGAAAGDLNIRTSDLLGFQLQGRGLQASWRARGLSVKGMAARPTGLDGATQDGHVAAAEIGIAAGGTAGSLVASSSERSDALGLPESSVRAALARVETSRGGHWFGIDAGPMQVSNRRTSEAETGPAVDARYAFRGPRADVDLRFRKLPDLLSDPRLPPTEMRAVATIRPGRALSASGTVYDEAVPQSLQFPGTRARGARAGLRWGESTWAVGLTGDLREVHGVVSETRRMARMDATLRAGDFTFDGSLGLGTTRIGAEEELAELYRLGGSWLAERGMVTFHVTVSDDILQPTSTLLDAYGVYRLNEVVELYGAATTFVILQSEGFAPASISDGMTVQTGARFRLSPNRFLYAGIERFAVGGAGDARWRLSAGVQQGLPLPLPLRRPAAASGVVFEDLDGNGRKEGDEPGLDGVMLRMGFERTVSRTDGSFEFRDAEPGPIEVDPRSLGDDFAPASGYRVPPSGTVEIGLYRAGGLRVTAFLDANADGVWDADELPAAAISVSLSRDDEPWVMQTGPDGAVFLSSVPPGTYLIRVDGQSLPSRALPPEIRSVEVRGGEMTEVRVPIPMRQISFTQFGEAGPCGGTAAVCDDD